jgi:hypothetical protein
MEQTRPQGHAAPLLDAPAAGAHGGVLRVLPGLVAGKLRAVQRELLDADGEPHAGRLQVGSRRLDPAVRHAGWLAS